MTVLAGAGAVWLAAAQPLAVPAAVPVVSAAVCALVLLVGRERRLAALLAGLALAAALATAPVGGLPARAGAVALPCLLLAFLLGLPTGRLISGARRVTVAVTAVGCVVSALLLTLTGTDAHPAVLGGLLSALVLATWPAVSARHRSGSARMRQRLQLLAAVALLGTAAVLVEVVLGLAAAGPPVPRLALSAAATLLPVALAASLVRWVWRRATAILVAAASAVALAAAVAAGLLGALGALGRLPHTSERPAVLAMVVAVGTAAAVAPPLVAAATREVRRAARGLRDSPEEVLLTLAERARRGVPLQDLLEQLGESLRRTMALDAVEIWTGDGDRLSQVLTVPRGGQDAPLEGDDLQTLGRAGVAGEVWASVWLPRVLRQPEERLRLAPAVDFGRVVGLLVARRDRDSDRFTASDDRDLGEVAQRLAGVLHTWQLNNALEATLEDLQRSNVELRASRARLVAAADAERRRIERDIHDGAQQHLVALAVTLGLARDLLGEDPEAVAELLEAMAVDVRETVQEVRDLAHGIYPPLLKESGLAEALRAAAARSPLAVHVDAEGTGRCDAAVEAAVYFCCLEALQNAAKHAPGSSVDVRVGVAAGELTFAVDDDGPGLPEGAPRSGQGFQNMADRLGAVGGTVRWEAAPGGGTRVLGTVPLTAQRLTGQPPAPQLPSARQPLDSPRDPAAALPPGA